jgi:hypothetical protein
MIHRSKLIIPALIALSVFSYSPAYASGQSTESGVEVGDSSDNHGDAESDNGSDDNSNSDNGDDNNNDDDNGGDNNDDNNNDDDNGGDNDGNPIDSPLPPPPPKSDGKPNGGNANHDSGLDHGTSCAAHRRLIYVKDIRRGYKVSVSRSCSGVHVIKRKKHRH